MRLTEPYIGSYTASAERAHPASPVVEVTVRHLATDESGHTLSRVYLSPVAAIRLARDLVGTAGIIMHERENP